MLEGELVLIEDGGETVLKPGEAAGWKAGSPTAITWSTARSSDARLSRSRHARASASARIYPDVDLMLDAR